ncbi:MoxR family ATPase [Sulfurimonas sp. HSL-1716]|uniref:MoxR family ATPase n=1 Tax=Hydrocurvibacter sulfurireducens TaxID=3131937 RepID=UPI0031F772B9
MKASEIKNSVEAMVEQKIPTFLWGAPGIGKSSIIRQIAEQKDIGFIDLRLSLMDPTDLKGIPFYDKHEHSAVWAAPSFLPKEGRGILFLDELNSAPPAVQASAYQLILDRRVGEYELPAGWAIVAAGNRESDRGVVYRMPSPLANRFVHLEMDVDVGDYKEWAFKNGIDERIIAYVGYKNENLFTFDATKNEKSFATPRSWEFVDRVLKSPMDEKLLLDSIGGAVGHDIAVDFLSFCKVAGRLPDIEEILASGEGEYPSDVDVLYALSAGLVSKTLKNKERLDNLLRYTLELQSEFAVMIVQELQRYGVRMEHSQEFKNWVRKFSYLLS